MSKTMKDFVAEARSATGVVHPDDAHGSGALILDVREAHELAEAGQVQGAIHVPRGFLEARADPTTDSAHPELAQAHGERTPVYVLCASGARAALAAKTLTEMGYDARPIDGGIQAWRDCGLPVAD